jgi:hypothetical protein
MLELLGDPRNAERVAQESGQTQSERQRIEAEIDFNQGEETHC